MICMKIEVLGKNYKKLQPWITISKGVKERACETTRAVLK